MICMWSRSVEPWKTNTCDTCIGLDPAKAYLESKYGVNGEIGEVIFVLREDF